MIENLITVILAEIVIILGMYIISGIANMMFYEDPEPVIYSGELTDEQAQMIKEVFENNKEE